MNPCLKCGFIGHREYGRCSACGFNELEDQTRKQQEQTRKQQEIVALLEKILKQLKEGVITYER